MLSVIILTHGGAELLIDRIASLPDVRIAAVIAETPIKPQRSLITRVRRSLRYEGYLPTIKKFSSSVLNGNSGSGVLTEIAGKQNELEIFATERGIAFHRVDDFHSESSLELIESLHSDLGILYGTNIIRQEVFSKPRLGTINLHQGLAPLYRGGPTVFWELFNGESEIGITVHFVVAKVDAGDVIVQRRIPLNYEFDVYALDYERFLADYRRSLKEPSIAAIGESVEKIARGEVQPIKQDLSIGKRYRLPTKREKDQLRKKLKARMSNIGTANKVGVEL